MIFLVVGAVLADLLRIKATAVGTNSVKDRQNYLPALFPGCRSVESSLTSFLRFLVLFDDLVGCAVIRHDRLSGGGSDGRTFDD